MNNILQDLINAPYGYVEKLAQQKKIEEKWENITQYCHKLFPHSVDVGFQIYIPEWNINITHNGDVVWVDEEKSASLSLGEVRRLLGILAQFKGV